MEENSESSFLSDSSSDGSQSFSDLSDPINEQLINAVSNGDTTEVKLCIDKGADLTFKNGSGLNSLNIAASYGHVEIIKIILETDRGRDSVNELNARGLSALHEVILADPDKCPERLETIRFLINCKNIDLTIEMEGDITDRGIPIGTKSIMLAVMLNDIKVLELLLQKEKKDLYLSDYEMEGTFSYESITMPSDSNILHLATLLRRKEIIEFLLKEYHDLAEERNSSIYDPDVEDEKGSVKPFYYAVLPENKEADEEIIILYVNFMIANNTINAYIDKKNNLLHLACKNNWLKVLDALGESSKVDFHRLNRDGHTALKIAQIENQPEVLKKLHQIATNHPEKKIDPNAYNAEASKARKYGEDYDEFIEDVDLDLDSDTDEQLREILKPEHKERSFEEDSQSEIEDLPPFIASIISGNIDIAKELLNHPDLDLEFSDDKTISRAITISKNAVDKEDIKTLLRLENAIKSSLRNNKPGKIDRLKNQLKKYCTLNLGKLIEYSKINILDKSVLEGWINFNIQKKSIITPVNFIEIIEQIISAREHEEKKLDIPRITILSKRNIFAYIIMLAAHAIHRNSNVSSGEERKLPMTLYEIKKFFG